MVTSIGHPCKAFTSNAGSCLRVGLTPAPDRSYTWLEVMGNLEAVKVRIEGVVSLTAEDSREKPIDLATIQNSHDVDLVTPDHQPEPVITNSDATEAASTAEPLEIRNIFQRFCGLDTLYRLSNATQEVLVTNFS